MHLPTESEEIHLTISDFAISYSPQFSSTHFHVAAEKETSSAKLLYSIFLPIETNMTLLPDLDQNLPAQHH